MTREHRGNCGGDGSQLNQIQWTPSWRRYTVPERCRPLTDVRGSDFFGRARQSEPPAFRVPLYPIVPVAFCLMCLYMLYSGIDYVRNPDYGPKFGLAVLAGVVVMMAGIPLYFLSERK